MNANRKFLGAGVLLALGMCWACLPDPKKDFADFQDRVANASPGSIADDPDSGADGDASSRFDASPPAEATKNVYYGTCLSELAFGQVDDRFSFYTEAAYAPGSGGGTLTLSITALKLESGKPPATFLKQSSVGSTTESKPSPVQADGRFTLNLGTTTIAGTANPISGSDVEILDTVFDGRFGTDRFCARLSGNLVKPAAASRILNPAANICQFYKLSDGDKVPELSFADFKASTCPL